MLFVFNTRNSLRIAWNGQIRADRNARPVRSFLSAALAGPLGLVRTRSAG